MAVRKILRMGHPTLRQVARPLSSAEAKSESISRLVGDMVETLHDYGGIGLAAPQVNESVRLALVEIPNMGSRYGELDPLPMKVFVNPVVTVLDASSAGFWEGCLSLPGLRGWVERPQHIRVDYRDLDFCPHSNEFKGFQATLFQHEFDHLDGRLFVDRMTDISRLVYEEEYAKFGIGEESG